MMGKCTEFDDIRPYCNEEVTIIIDRLLKDAEFRRVAKFVIPDGEWEKTVALMLSVKNIHDFQHNLVKDIMTRMIDKTAASIECAGLENIENGKTHTFISNHRDIVLDASLLCTILIEHGYETTEIAIGDNLLLYPWIEDFVRLNKSFIVKRGISIRQMLEVSNHLSHYIHYAIKEKKESIWIAQREGRAKDSNDRTQESLLKMLAMNDEKKFLKNLKELNITPVSFSYEYDPCDYLKAKEFQQKRDNFEFKKTEVDDLLNMTTGISGYKGRIHVQFGQSINPELLLLDTQMSKNKLAVSIASIIDKTIFLNYQFYPGNYIAYDRLWGHGHFAEKYSAKEIQTFDIYLQKQLSKIDLENKDLSFLTKRILEMYAYPLKNHLEITSA